MQAIKKRIRTISHAKVNARSGVSVPSYAIVSSNGFRNNLDAVKRIASKTAQVRRTKDTVK